MLSDLERRIVAWSEQSWFLYNRLPTPDELCDKFLISPKKLNEILSKESIQKSFEERGMPVVEGRDLSYEQVTAVNTILNTTDQRSRRKKLQDLGISEKKWDGWMQDPAFAKYWSARSEKILSGAIPEAHLALVENVKHGHESSIKLLYEITGRYTGKDDQIDVRMVINKVFEIISRRVQDPQVLLAIASDLKLLTALDSSSSIPPVATPQAESVIVRGELGDVL